MGVYSSKDKSRHYVEFQYKGKRVKKWLPRGTTLDEAVAAEARMRRALKNEKEGFVYFIKADNGEHFKIGFSLNPQKRLQSLRTGSGRNLELLAVRPGSPQLEKDLHFHFRQNRGLGEWFWSSNIYADLDRFENWNEDVQKRDTKIWLDERLGRRRRRFFPLNKS